MRRCFTHIDSCGAADPQQGVTRLFGAHRDSPLYRVVYHQRTACERINSQAQALGIERPKARNIRSIRTLNTLIYLTINIKALQRVKAINACLLRFPLTLTG